MSDETKVLAALASAGAAGLTQTEIRIDVFGHHRTKNQLRSLLEGLRDDGVWCQEEAPARGGKRPVLRWRGSLNMHQARGVQPNNSEGAVITDSSGLNMHDASEEFADVAAVDAALAEGGEPIPWEQVMKDLGWTPPEGEGWVKWDVIVRIAEAGVPPGFALRQGRKFRAKQRKTKKQLAAIPNEQYAAYGKRRISHSYLSTAIKSGAIERRGEWCRLVRDPVRTPRMWMGFVYQALGQAHPTLTGEFTRKPPKTLDSVMQEHLGRELLPEEFVRRRPGKGGSWDPADMKLHSRLLKPSDVELNQQRLDDYRAQVEQAPQLQERPTVTARLPKVFT